MKYKIGVDFDNTIACYDSVFAYGARLLGVNVPHTVFSKGDVKNHILAAADGDITWQKVQGQIYGKLMHRAAIFDGFIEFLKLAKLQGHQIFIISHKTPFGHFDDEKYSLPEQALRWLVTNQIVGSDAIPVENIFFEPTRELKLRRIQQLNCTHFIDDLTEVLDEPDFPACATKYLFNAHPRNEHKDVHYFEGSWRSITSDILGEWSEADVLAITQKVFGTLAIEQAILTKGRGNSRIYKLRAASDKSYALKIYPDLQTDSRPRLATEFSACEILSEAGFPVVKAVAKNTELNWAAFQWIDGNLAIANDEFIYKSLKFVEELRSFSRSSPLAAGFPQASEACLSGTNITDQIERRLNNLMGTGNKFLTVFLEDEFLPVFNDVVVRAKGILNGNFHEPLGTDSLIISPSDFGAHNAITDAKNETYFIDFEYFGWDDPVKLACDFYWHPGMNLNNEHQKLWMNQIKSIFVDDESFAKRITSYLPIFGLRWCLILLNEFLKDKIVQRVRADQEKGADISSMQSRQFAKSQNILENIKSLLNYG